MESLAGFGEFVTPRFLARSLFIDDAEAVKHLTDDPAITGMVDFLAQPFGMDDAIGLIKSQQGGRDRFFGIWNHEGALVAVAGAHLHGDDRIEIGYWVGRAFHGQGYATEIALALLSELEKRFQNRQLVAECRPENGASWAVLRKCGFVPAGIDGKRAGRQLLIRPK